jgi:hypothetical protein
MVECHGIFFLCDRGPDCTLLWRNETITRPKKLTWTLCLMFFFPVAHLALIYRLYWHEPVRVARSLSDVGIP